MNAAIDENRLAESEMSNPGVVLRIKSLIIQNQCPGTRGILMIWDFTPDVSATASGNMFRHLTR